MGRSTVFHANLLDELIEQGLRKRGFAVIEAVSHCPTMFGRKNRLGGPVEMLLDQQRRAVRVAKAQKMSPEELADKIIIGVLADRDLPYFTQEMQRIREAAQKAAAQPPEV